MFRINSREMKPNHVLALAHAQDWCVRGMRFDPSAWRDVTEAADTLRAQLVKIGLKNPNSPAQVERFLRSYNSLEIAAVLYDVRKAKWNLSVDALGELADKFTGLPDLTLLFEYKRAEVVAQSFRSLERLLTAGSVVHPKVKLTRTNRIMFVEPHIEGMPKCRRPFRPLDNDCVLLSVDVKTQEPGIILGWFGSNTLRKVVDAEPDIYTGVARAAFVPRVSVGGGGNPLTSVPRGGTWTWGTGDTLLYVENAREPEQKKVAGVFESGKRRQMPVLWVAGKGGALVGEINPTSLTYNLTKEQRDEVKKVWNRTAYGGGVGTAGAACTEIDGETLAKYIRSEVVIPKNAATYFGTPLVTGLNAHRNVVCNHSVQGTGADLMALLIERFYSEPRPDKMDIYFTRYDELVLQVPLAFIAECGGEGVGDYLRDIFEHTVDGFRPFRVDVEVF
ncbi:hypothetical protein FACS1894208_00170 [Clostridia bacterium]|nr:hypothetical protein FACS1894208_00170 [Clostridia bacterium]